MTKYVVGFIFNPDYEKILLIRKNRPINQRGLLNGVGGHVELGESSYDAMVRECMEESNLMLYNWLYLGFITDSNDYKVDCYTTMVTNFDKVKPLTDEVLEIIPIDKLDYTQLVHPADIMVRLAMNPEFNPIKLITR